jgi:hypothetical protein
MTPSDTTWFSRPRLLVPSATAVTTTTTSSIRWRIAVTTTPASTSPTRWTIRPPAIVCPGRGMFAATTTSSALRGRSSEHATRGLATCGKRAARGLPTYSIYRFSKIACVASTANETVSTRVAWSPATPCRRSGLVPNGTATSTRLCARCTGWGWSFAENIALTRKEPEATKPT